MTDLFESPKSKKKQYSAKDIEVLEGLEPVRKRPGMYIGGTDERALHHLAAEVLDNSMDEAQTGSSLSSRVMVLYPSATTAAGYLSIHTRNLKTPRPLKWFLQRFIQVGSLAVRRIRHPAVFTELAYQSSTHFQRNCTLKLPATENSGRKPSVGANQKVN